MIDLALTQVTACVFPSSAERQGFITARSYPAGSALIQVGRAALIIVAEVGLGSPGQPPIALVQSIASKTGGTITSY